MTFGLLWSNDNGMTWRWMCEDALPYGGPYDPSIVYTETSAVFATTYDGLNVNRDGCTFLPSVVSPPLPELKFFSRITQAADGIIYAVASDPAESAVYASSDDGLSFPLMTPIGLKGDWWETIKSAPSDSSRLYLSGFRFVTNPGGGATKVHLLFTSTDGGVSWTALPTGGFATMANSTIEIVGISRTNPDLVFAKVTLSDNAISDTLYRSTNGGQTWSAIRTVQGSISFVVRASGELVIGTQTQGAFKSSDNGATWSEVAGAPHINCLVENAAGELWACTQNYGIPQVPMDGFGIMKTSDLSTWVGVLRFQEIAEPVACAMETPQYKTCDRPIDPMMGWCALCAQLGCDPKRECAGIAGDGAPDAGPGVPPGDDPGCCDASGGAAPGVLALVAAVGMVLFGRRRRR